MPKIVAFSSEHKTLISKISGAILFNPRFTTNSSTIVCAHANGFFFTMDGYIASPIPPKDKTLPI